MWPFRTNEVGILGWVVLTAQLCAPSAWAVDRYVDNRSAGTTGCSQPSDNDYNPALRTCSSGGTSLVYNAVTTGINAMAGGDHLFIMGGTYAGSTSHLSNVPSGTVANPTIIEGDPNDLQGCALSDPTPTCSTILMPASGAPNSVINNRQNLIIRKLRMSGQTNPNYVMLFGGTPCTNVQIEDVATYDTSIVSGATGLGIGNTCSFFSMTRWRSYNNGNQSTGTGGLGGYLSGDDLTVRDSWIHDNAYYGIQFYSSVSGTIADRCKIYNSIIEGNGGGLWFQGVDGEAVGNVIRNNGNGITTTAVRTLIAHNVVSAGIGLGSNGNASNAIVRNNAILGSVTIGPTTTGTTISNNACRSSDSCGSSKLTITSFASIFLSTTDYRLSEGSSAINAGSTTSLSAQRPCNGVCDIGPNEAFTYSSGTVTGNTAEVILTMNVNTPVRPTSAGWSIACTPNPTACPSISLTSVTLKSGSSSTVQITYSGSACSTGQIWTVSYAGSTGNTTDSIGLSLKQELTTFTTQPLTSSGCTGGGGPPPPGGLHIHYKFDDGSGTNANDETVNNLDGTLFTGTSWVSAVNATGVSMVNGTSQRVDLPYGNTIDPSSQSLTIAFWVKPELGSSGGIYFGSPVGTNQRLYIAAVSNTWRIAIQGVGASTASNLAFVPGSWARVCLVLNSSTDTATLAINGENAAAGGGGVKTYTSYALAGNFQLGRIDGNNAPGAVYDDFKLWTSVESCADDYVAANPPATAWTGNLAMVSFRFYGAKTVSGSARALAAPSTNTRVPVNGAFTVAIQTDGTVANPSPIAERLYYSCSPSPCSGLWSPVPDMATSDGIQFWGTSNESGLLSGAHGANLSGSLPHVAGGTNKTADSIPVFDLAQDTSTVMRWILRIAPGTPHGRTFCFKPREQTGIELNGYTPSAGACITTRRPSSSGF